VDEAAVRHDSFRSNGDCEASPLDPKGPAKSLGLFWRQSFVLREGREYDAPVGEPIGDPRGRGLSKMFKERIAE
jgi:hypothetical protein